MSQQKDINNLTIKNCQNDSIIWTCILKYNYKYKGGGFIET